MNYIFEIKKLTKSFYDIHNGDEDIIRKTQRAFNVLLVDVKDYYICIPFRSHISHEYAYKFKDSERSKTNDSGLDYTKICIINDSNYIDNSITTVDNDEYKEMISNIDIIVEGAINYIDEYIDHINGIKTLSKRKFSKKYKYSSLKYFHSELGVNK